MFTQKKEISMEITLRSIFENALYLLALLNPASKIMFLAAYQPALGRGRNFELSWKSSVAALLILILLAAAGQFLLGRIFRVELYSLQITGGLVVFMIGWTAVSKGRFVQKQQKSLMEGLKAEQEKMKATEKSATESKPPQAVPKQEKGKLENKPLPPKEIQTLPPVDENLRKNTASVR